MIFHSLDFLVFFGIVFTIYWLLPRKGQNLLLLGASYFFYGYIHLWYVGLLIFTSTLEWIMSNAMTRKPEKKRLFLTVTLVTNFSILAAFKYFDFFSGGNALKVLHGLGFTWLTAEQVKNLLPVGISFYTFQSAAYMIDVYRGRIAPQRNILEYFAFVSFFPQLVAGPIERAGHMAKQFAADRHFDLRLARGAIVLILWGYLKKLAIADNAALICNKVFSLDQPPWPVLWAGVFAFGVQIYADFSAYSDIARGVARLLGFELIKNFDHPYTSATPTEFWRRWHISLSSWFRDYFYIPLGGSRCGKARVCFNLMATFLVSGLWHGASWNFIIWGGFHGLLLVLWRFWENGSERWRPERFWRWPQVLLTFILVNIGWLFFREQDLDMLWKYLTLNPAAASAIDWRVGLYLFTNTMLYAFPLWIHAALEPWIQKRSALAEQDDTAWKWTWVQGAAAALFFVAMLLMRSPASSDFIYFQF